MAEGFTGHGGGETVQDQISTGGARGDAAVIGVEGHAGHLFFMILADGKTSILVAFSLRLLEYICQFYSLTHNNTRNNKQLITGVQCF